MASKPLSTHNRSAINQVDAQTDKPEQPVYYFAESTGTLQDVLKCAQPGRYIAAMQDEWTGLVDNKVFEAVALPPDADTLPLFSFFTDKMDADNRWIKSKCRTVARGDLQDWWQYFNTSASVLLIQHFRTFIALCACFTLVPFCVDVMQAFLHVPLEELIYIRLTKEVMRFLPASLAKQLQAIRDKGGRPGLRLLKTLYGLKQGPHNWLEHLEGSLKEYGLRQMEKSGCLWTLHDADGNLLLLVCNYVDDIGFASSSESERQRFVAFLQSKYKVGDAEEMTSYIGIKVSRDATSGDIHLSQPGHIQSGLDRFHMTNSKSAITPMVPHNSTSLKEFCPEEDSQEAAEMAQVPYAQLLGLLNYLSVTTRPDIAVATRQLAQVMHKPGKRHWKMAKRVLAYLGGSRAYGLRFRGGSEPRLYGHSDSSHAENRDHSRSTSGFLTMMAGAPINWGVHLQDSVAISTGESEFYGLYYLTLDVLGFRELLKELGFPQRDATILDCDNQSAIAWAYGKGRLSSLKHVRLKYHLVQQTVASSEVEVHYLETHRMPADFLTKVLNRELFENCRGAVMTLPDDGCSSQLPVQGGVKMRDCHLEDAGQCHQLKQEQNSNSEGTLQRGPSLKLPDQDSSSVSPSWPKTAASCGLVEKQMTLKSPLELLREPL